MPTAKQLELHRKLFAMFGRTPEWRAIARDDAFPHMTPEQAYIYLGDAFTATRRWRYIRLPRYAGLPRTSEERRASLKRALREERHARLVCPDDERETWCADTRPSAMDAPWDYLELQDELKEATEMDRGLFRPLPTYLVTHVRP